MSTAAYFTALRQPRPAGARVMLVGRPGSPVVHIFTGAATRSGRSVPATARPVCGASTRRLYVLDAGRVPGGVSARRVCGSCSSRLSAVARRGERLVTRDQYLSAYDGRVSLRDLAVAATLTRSVEETHTVGYLAGLLFPPPPVRITAATSDEQVALYWLHQRILNVRRYWSVAEQTPEQVAEIHARREADAHNDRLVRDARRKAAARDRALDRQHAGSYLTPYERSLVHS